MQVRAGLVNAWLASPELQLQIRRKGVSSPGQNFSLYTNVARCIWIYDVVLGFVASLLQSRGIYYGPQELRQRFTGPPTAAQPVALVLNDLHDPTVAPTVALVQLYMFRILSEMVLTQALTPSRKAHGHGDWLKQTRQNHVMSCCTLGVLHVLRLG